MVYRVLRIIHLLLFWTLTVTTLLVAMGFVLSYATDVTWEYDTQSLSKDAWWLVVMLYDGMIRVEYRNVGAEVPLLILMIVLGAYPGVVAVNQWRRRNRRRGFPVVFADGSGASSPQDQARESQAP